MSQTKKRISSHYSRVIGTRQKKLLSIARTIHGHAKTSTRNHSRTYQSWMSMKERCDDAKHKSFSDYGGRGIRYCSEWRNFVAFLRDMGERPDGMTIGRKNNNGLYSKANCCWQTWKEQANNRRNSRIISFAGERATLSQWSDRTGINSAALAKRLKAGWPLNKALTVPVRYGQRVMT